MNLVRKLLGTSLALMTMLGAGAAGARGPHIHFGLAFGGPVFWSDYYAYPWPYAYGPAPYYPPVVGVPRQPTVYIERDSGAPSASVEHWWYYCAEAKTYYPYVKECRGGWQRVSPRPPS